MHRSVSAQPTLCPSGNLERESTNDGKVRASCLLESCLTLSLPIQRPESLLGQLASQASNFHLSLSSVPVSHAFPVTRLLFFHLSPQSLCVLFQLLELGSINGRLSSLATFNDLWQLCDSWMNSIRSGGNSHSVSQTTCTLRSCGNICHGSVIVAAIGIGHTAKALSALVWVDSARACLARKRRWLSSREGISGSRRGLANCCRWPGWGTEDLLTHAARRAISVFGATPTESRVSSAAPKPCVQSTSPKSTAPASSKASAKAAPAPRRKFRTESTSHTRGEISSYSRCSAWTRWWGSCTTRSRRSANSRSRASGRRHCSLWSALATRACGRYSRRNWPVIIPAWFARWRNFSLSLVLTITIAYISRLRRITRRLWVGSTVWLSGIVGIARRASAQGSSLICWKVTEPTGMDRRR